MAVAAMCTAGGVLGATGAVAPAVAHADIATMAPQVFDKVSRDGWHLQIKIDHESINSVPNLAAAVNSREGFVTASGTATATGGSAPITDSIFILGYQLGCQSDVSTGLQLGGTAGVAPSASIGSTTAIGGTAGIAGFVQTVVQPGVIVDLPLANMSLDDTGQAMLDIDNIHIKADACGGDVNIRSYAYLRISTAKSHTEFAIYGDPSKI
ncbi:MspA family protein [Mycobacterium sp. CBMA 234]|nr:MspA family porin [Mycolicibacterium sp. CBMA 234]MUL62873.1 MspA family protein [Mycolicibacterium sp. CBMA 234]